MPADLPPEQKQVRNESGDYDDCCGPNAHNDHTGADEFRRGVAIRRCRTSKARRRDTDQGASTDKRERNQEELGAPAAQSHRPAPSTFFATIMYTPTF